VTLTKRAAHRLSQRGAVLLILAAVDLVYALALAAAPPQTLASETYRFYASLLPLPYWGGMWAAVGVLCAIQAWYPRDRIAYSCATGLKVFWALLHLGAWVTGVLPRGYVLAVIWLLAAGLVMVVSTVPKGAAR
jgi:predicted branched-subunit amino acid permease